MDPWIKTWMSVNRPVRFLLLLFVLWKTVLFVVILCSPGPGYDTSTTLLDLANPQPDRQTDFSSSPSLPTLSILRLVRWDAIYYSQISRRGHVFEQEWAFGIGSSRLVSFISTSISQSCGTSSDLLEIGAAIVLSHITHFLAVLLLYGLTQRISKSYGVSSVATSTLAAALYIISPAGAFLSAPYSESLFAALNFLGFYLYLDGRIMGGSLGEVETIVAGVSMGCATVVRSNGILGGLPFLYDAFSQVVHLLRDGISTQGVRKLLVLGIGGALIALGAFLPQYEAYQTFCKDNMQHERRPWCDHAFPSIFAWVQQHYWNTGLFRYWKLSNLPLFLLAIPCLWILLVSSIWACSRSSISATSTDLTSRDTFDRESLIRLAIPQAVLALAALTSYHVQIINRISSGYPLWYIWLASMIANPKEHSTNNLISRHRASEFMVRTMAIYAIVQGGLFASFLPPA